MERSTCLSLLIIATKLLLTDQQHYLSFSRIVSLKLSEVWPGCLVTIPWSGSPQVMEGLSQSRGDDMRLVCDHPPLQGGTPTTPTLESTRNRLQVISDTTPEWGNDKASRSSKVPHTTYTSVIVCEEKRLKGCLLRWLERKKRRLLGKLNRKKGCLLRWMERKKKRKET